MKSPLLRPIFLACTLTLLGSASFATRGTPAEDATNVASFLGSGVPTFVLGTTGADAADRGVAAQVRFLRGLLFPTAPIVLDTSFDASKGAAEWPATPVLYGGAHLNATLAALGGELPFKVTAGRLEIAGRVYEGDEYRLIAVVPSAAPSEAGPGHPNFLLYAGAGTPGVTEINAVRDYGFGFVVADRFGRLDMGRFVRNEDGVRAEVTESARRLVWRDQPLEVGDDLGTIIVHRLQLEAVDANDAPENEACLRGLRASARKLGVASVDGLELYIYPDRRSKKLLCWSEGDGNADISSSTLHVLPFDAGEGGPMERLIQHEATHILASRAFGTPGSALWGEGLAVWAAGGYGGQPLTSFDGVRLPRQASLEAMLGARFSQVPEGTSYPLAGRIVQDLIEVHGLATFLERFYPSTPSELEATCDALGTSAAAIEAKYTR